MCCLQRIDRIQIQLIQHVEDTVCPKRDTDTRNAIHAKYTGQVVISSATGDTSYLNIQGFNFEDGTGIIVQTASQRQVEFQFRMHRQLVDTVENEGHFFDTLHGYFRGSQLFFQDGQFFSIATRQHDDRLQAGNRLFGKTFGTQFFVYIIQTDLIQFVDSHCYINNLIRFTDNFGNTRQYLTVVHFDANTDTETVEHLIHDLDQFHFINQ